MCLMVFIDPKFQSSPLQRWKNYGVLWRADLSFNGHVFMEADNVIRSSAGREVYVDPALAMLAIKRNLTYVDNGNREYYVEYINDRINGVVKLSPLTSWLAAREPGGSKRESPFDIRDPADVVICTLSCPNKGSHQFVKSLGVLTTAFNGSMVVQLYHRERNN
jgi:hypothetical protein